MISVIAVNWHSNDWAKLLVESHRRYSKLGGEVLIVENTPRNVRTPVDGDRVIVNEEDTTHGAGLNVGVRNAKHDLVLVLDIDCHFLAAGWEKLFVQALAGHHAVTVAGSEFKPIRPACLFMHRKDAERYDWRATPGYQGHRVTPDGYDVGIAAYHEMVREGKKVAWMQKGEFGESRYGTLTGEEYGLGDTPLIYHHWHGSHLRERNKVDYVEHDLLAEKIKLFKQIPWRRRAKMV